MRIKKVFKRVGSTISVLHYPVHSRPYARTSRTAGITHTTPHRHGTAREYRGPYRGVESSSGVPSRRRQRRAGRVSPSGDQRLAPLRHVPAGRQGPQWGTSPCPTWAFKTRRGSPRLKPPLRSVVAFGSDFFSSVKKERGRGGNGNKKPESSPERKEWAAASPANGLGAGSRAFLCGWSGGWCRTGGGVCACCCGWLESALWGARGRDGVVVVVVGRIHAIDAVPAQDRARPAPPPRRHGREVAAADTDDACACDCAADTRGAAEGLAATEAAGQGLRLGAGRGRRGREGGEAGGRRRGGGGGVGRARPHGAQLHGGVRGRRRAAPAWALQLLQRQQLRGERRRGGLLPPLRPRLRACPRRRRRNPRGSQGSGAECERGGAEPPRRRVPDRGAVRQDLQGKGRVPSRGGRRPQGPRLRRRRLQVALGEDPLLPSRGARVHRRGGGGRREADRGGGFPVGVRGCALDQGVPRGAPGAAAPVRGHAGPARADRGRRGGGGEAEPEEEGAALPSLAQAGVHARQVAVPARPRRRQGHRAVPCRHVS